MGERLFNPQHAHKLEDPQRQVWMPAVDVIRALRVRRGMRIVDIGAGTGYFALPLAEAVGPEGKVYAVDLQPEMLELLREKLAAANAPRNVELLQGEASKVRLASECADLVLIANVWHEVDDQEAALREAARLLAPRGSLAVLDWRADMDSPPGPPSHHRVASSSLLQFLKKNGWKANREILIGSYSYLVSAKPPARQR
jgi:ubiquinone/menaquinone biosynthesis C-methylase UbiE